MAWRPRLATVVWRPRGISAARTLVQFLVQFQRHYLVALNDDVAATPSFNVTFRRRP